MSIEQSYIGYAFLLNNSQTPPLNTSLPEWNCVALSPHQCDNTNKALGLSIDILVRKKQVQVGGDIPTRSAHGVLQL